MAPRGARQQNGPAIHPRSGRSVRLSDLATARQLSINLMGYAVMGKPEGRPLRYINWPTGARRHDGRRQKPRGRRRLHGTDRGGKARAEKLSSEERSKAAKAAASFRWAARSK
jgi:hypothetical protein